MFNRQREIELESFVASSLKSFGSQGLWGFAPLGICGVWRDM